MNQTATDTTPPPTPSSTHDKLGISHHVPSILPCSTGKKFVFWKRKSSRAILHHVLHDSASRRPVFPWNLSSRRRRREPVFTCSSEHQSDTSCHEAAPWFGGGRSQEWVGRSGSCSSLQVHQAHSSHLSSLTRSASAGSNSSRDTRREGAVIIPSEITVDHARVLQMEQQWNNDDDDENDDYEDPKDRIHFPKRTERDGTLQLPSYRRLLWQTYE